MLRVALIAASVALANDPTWQSETVSTVHPAISLAELEADLAIITNLDSQLDSSSPDATRRGRYLKQLMADARHRKRGWNRFLEKLPGRRRDETMKRLRDQLRKHFSAQLFRLKKNKHLVSQLAYQDLTRKDARLVRLACLMKQRQLTTLEDLDIALQGFGSSLALQEQAFAETLLAGVD